MIRILDFLYYFIYQLNRRGYKTYNHENAKLGTASIICSILISYKRFVPLIVKHYLGIYFLYDYWTLIIFLISVFIFYLTGRYYGPKGFRNWVVEKYDSSSNLKKQNHYIQVFVLTTIIMSNFLLCLKIGNELKYYFEHHPRPVHSIIVDN
jgi:hypothetical protein